jgi:hypothetical protein
VFLQHPAGDEGGEDHPFRLVDSNEELGAISFGELIIPHAIKLLACWDA